MDLTQINIWAVIVSAIASFGLGSVWYNPAVFGSAWMKAIGVTQEELEGKGHTGRTFLFAFLATVVMSFCLATYFLGQQDINVYSGAFYGFLTGFCWVSMSFVVNDLFENRPFVLTLINAGFNIVGYTIMGAILGAWR